MATTRVEKTFSKPPYVRDYVVATAAPTVNDDSGKMFHVGSRWFDSGRNVMYVATSVSVGAAVWKIMGVPSFTTTQRDALTSVPTGFTIYNSTTGAINYYNGSAWVAGLEHPLTGTIADPGNAGAIAVTGNGSCPIVSAGAETRTLAIPTFVGQTIALNMKTDGGDTVITVAQAINSTGNNTITLNDAGDSIVLYAVDIGGARRWRVLVNNGASLSTV